MPLERVSLEQLAREVGNAQSLEAVARPLLQLLQEITGLESTYVTRIDWEGDRQQVVYSLNTGTLTIPEALTVPWRDTLCRRALLEGRACTTDVPSVWGDSDAARELGLKTYVSVPIDVGTEEPFGTLCGASSKAEPVPDSALTILRLFARLLADQIQRQARLDEEQLRATQAEAYSQALGVIANLSVAANDANTLADVATTVVQQVVDYAGWHSGTCWCFDAQSGEWSLVTPQGSQPVAQLPALIARAWQQHSLCWSELAIHQQDTPQPIVAMPLPALVEYADGGVLGFYGDARGQEDHPYLDSVLEVAAHQLSHVLERQLMMQALHDANEKLARQATHDALTELSNRRYLEAHLGRLLAHNRRNGEQVTLAFIDLDGFKQINDVYGHDAGDAVLVEVGRRLTALVRDGDLVVRLGGDEFVLVTSSRPSEQVHPVLRQRIEASLADLTSPDFPEARLRGGSVGLVSPKDDQEGVEALLKRADELMYARKQERKRSA